MGAAFGSLKKEAQALMELAKSNDKSAIEAQRGKMLGTCGACHKVALSFGGGLTIKDMLNYNAFYYGEPFA